MGVESIVEANRRRIVYEVAVTAQEDFSGTLLLNRPAAFSLIKNLPIAAPSVEMSTVSDKLNFELAWKRVKNDSGKVIFCERPYQIDIIESNLSKWLDLVREEVDTGYRPDDMLVINVPKAGDLVRKGNYLSLCDRLVYNACVGALQKNIHDNLAWSQGAKDYSYQLTSDYSRVSWFEKSPYKYWKQFGAESIEEAERYNFVLVTDIASYYDGIHVRTLMAMLNSCGADAEVKDLLASCLSHWSTDHGRGIPQGMSASHILAKLYLNGLDQKLDNRGYEHKRYNDDIRVFCTSRDQAREAVVDIVETLRSDLGLNIQSAKTEIRSSLEMVTNLRRVDDILEAIQNEVTEKTTEVIPGDLEYDDIILALPEDEVSRRAIRNAVDEYLLSGSHPFDKTLFHYLIRRLDDKRAVSYCMSLLKKRPQETSHCLEYFSSVQAVSEQDDAISEFICSDSCIHNYQVYKILMWRAGLGDIEPSSNLTQTVRDIIFGAWDMNEVLVSSAYRFLDVFGNSADLNDLKNLAPQLNVRGKSEIVCAVKKMEKAQRNGFFGSLEGRDTFLDWSVQWVKQTT
jgi:retron-type reverse transcriptase